MKKAAVVWSKVERRWARAKLKQARTPGLPQIENLAALERQAWQQIEAEKRRLGVG